MHYGIVITTPDPRLASELAADAEAAGWDGVFTWDAISTGESPGFDPWIVLAAMAMRTTRVGLGAMVFAPSRRRPWKVARELGTLDLLSGGRIVFPVGLGTLDDQGFGAVGEAVEARTRAQRLDETLAIIDGLASGEPFEFHGEHYEINGLTLRPRPLQRPRIPVWVVGAWPHERSLRRAAHWDGIVVQGVDDGVPNGAPRNLAEIVAWLRRERDAAGLSGPYDVVVGASTDANDAEDLARVERAEADGATWWVEQDWEHTDPDALRARIDAGPPRARVR